jgi:ketosteroid isomerase-like protein
MTWRRLAPLAGAILLLTITATIARSSQEEEILAIETERTQAMIAGDLATLERILGDDLTYVHATGQVESKAEFLARLKSGDLKYKAMPREGVIVRVLGDAAVVTGKATLDAESKGESRTFPLRFTEVHVRRGGRWQMIAYQSTRIQ